jgi:aspartyl-tRNA(Asn)/glutamyl-tRNA(Gln) amidotransferase subunit A
MSYNNKSIKELHELLVNKEISALELTKATLSDISAREPQIDAFLKITEEKALQDAAAIDARGINPDVVTDGISIAVKDNIVTEGIETTAASKNSWRLDSTL